MVEAGHRKCCPLKRIVVNSIIREQVFDTLEYDDHPLLFNSASLCETISVPLRETKTTKNRLSEFLQKYKHIKCMSGLTPTGSNSRLSMQNTKNL